MTDSEFFDKLVEFIIPDNEITINQGLWIENLKIVLKENKNLKNKINNKIEELKIDMLAKDITLEEFSKKKYCYNTLKEILNM